MHCYTCLHIYCVPAHPLPHSLLAAHYISEYRIEQVAAWWRGGRELVGGQDGSIMLRLWCGKERQEGKGGPGVTVRWERGESEGRGGNAYMRSGGQRKRE